MPSAPQNLRVVLARPQTGQNVGFVARLCANHLVDDLVLVRPADDWHDGARITGAMCRERLETLQIVDTLETALADREIVVGLTARRGRDRQTTSVEHLHEITNAAGQVALVFGNEESGLDADETAQCTHLVHISRPGLKSLNLSHAVAIALHEWSRDATQQDEVPGSTPSLTTSEERTRLAKRTRETLAAWGFDQDDPHFDGALRRLVEAHAMQKRDARILAKVLRHLDWVRDNDGDATSGSSSKG